ncbi:MAG: rRNA maturation RNase YbeY [Patescibacteria group bacterium]|jgi:probable rRNA maturation factor
MIEINNTTRQRINLKKTREIAEKFLRVYKKNNYEVSLAIVGEVRMKYFNQKYRGINKTTDVLSFCGPAAETEGGRASMNRSKKFLGEIIINISETKKLEKYREMFQEINLGTDNRNKNSAYLFYFLMVHGLLHLVGYNDDREKERLKMLKLGRDFLEKIL